MKDYAKEIAEDRTVCSHCGKPLLKKNGRGYKNSCKYHLGNMTSELITRAEKDGLLTRK